MALYGRITCPYRLKALIYKNTIKLSMDIVKVDIIAVSGVPGLSQSIAKEMGTMPYYPLVERSPDGEVQLLRTVLTVLTL